MSRLALGVDTGGTFTDVVLVGLESGQVWTAKTPSTPADPSQAFVDGIDKIIGLSNGEIADLERIFHGTTVATNAILEGKGATTGLLTTGGFRHVLEIARHDVPREENIFGWVKPPRIVPPWMIEEIPGRLDVGGAEITPFDEPACRAAIERLVAEGAESIAVCFLHSYVNPDHERRARDIAAEVAPDVAVSLSSDVLPLFREYERTMATILNTYLEPLVGGYVGRLEERLTALPYNGPLFIMKSSGGVVSAGAAAERPAYVALSGPAAGVIGAGYIGAAAGRRDLISIDVGGTSADVCLIVNGSAELTSENQIGNFPLSLPMIDIHTIGAGGGSVASMNDIGALTVGPRSAGADPGPACYGRGGEEATVTDANLVLGRIPAHLLGGEVPLDVDAARRTIEEKLARPMGASIESAAEGVVEILDNLMAGAIRVVSIERGHDAREFALIAFGGAGPLHGGRLAQILNIPEIVIPPSPGVVAALGLLVTDLQNDYIRTCVQRPPNYDLDEINQTLDQLEAEALDWLVRERVSESSRQLVRRADLRYAHQGFEISVDCPAGSIGETAMAQIVGGFHRRHEQLYSYAADDTPVELVNLRVTAIGKIDQPQVATLERGTGAEQALAGTRPVWLHGSGAFAECPVYDRLKLGAGDTFDGPAIVEQVDSTSLILRGQRVDVDPSGSLILSFI